MTLNERKILECIWNHGGKAHIGLLGSKIGFSSDYSRFLCLALKRSGHLEFADANVCYLLTQGRNHFQRNDEPAPEEWSEAPQVVLASSALSLSGNGHDSDDKEGAENKDESGGPAVNDSDLDRVLASILSPASGQGEESKEEEKKEEGQKKEEGEKKEGADTGAAGLETEFVDESKTAESEERALEKVEENPLPEAKKEAALADIKDATPQGKEKLAEAGYKLVKDLAKTPIDRLIQGIGVSLEKAAHWINRVRRQTGVINEEGRKDKK